MGARADPFVLGLAMQGAFRRWLAAAGAGITTRGTNSAGRGNFVRATTRFKTLLTDPSILMIPVCHDPLGAKIVERAGFEVVGCAGYASSAALLGAPDVGLLTLTEMVDAVWRMADAVDLPVFADGDNGHGNVTNVARTVKMMEKAGAACLMLEDQVLPKRCGHMPGKAIVSRAQFLGKIRAALDARTDPDFTILARTDAIDVEGFDEAVERASLALEAGADWVFIEAPRTAQMLRAIPQRVKGLHLANMIPGGATPMVPAAELEAMGFAAVIFPNVFTYAYAKVAMEAAASLRRTGGIAGLEDKMLDFAAFNTLVGLPQIRDKEGRFDD